MSDSFVPAETLEILGLDTLKVMADSLRMQLVDLLRRESATVKELAAALTVSPKSLYYHVNLLEKHGLIRVVDTRLVSGIMEKRYRATAYLFNFNEIANSPESTPGQAGLEAISSLFTITQDEIRVALEGGMIDPSEDSSPDCLTLEWTLLNLSPSQRGELEGKLRALIEEYATEDAASGIEQPYRLLVTMFPTYRRGERPTVHAPAPSREDNR